MAAAVPDIADKTIGDSLAITGTGFANSTAYTMTVKLPGPGSPSIKIKGTTSAGGAITDTSAIAEIQLANAGEVTVIVSDGTSTVTKTFRVWHSG